jgi:hypothetical protein
MGTRCNKSNDILYIWVIFPFFCVDSLPTLRMLKVNKHEVCPIFDFLDTDASAENEISEWRCMVKRSNKK